jgi:hypothetical protein
LTETGARASPSVGDAATGKTARLPRGLVFRSGGRVLGLAYGWRPMIAGGLAVVDGVAAVWAAIRSADPKMSRA